MGRESHITKEKTNKNLVESMPKINFRSGVSITKMKLSKDSLVQNLKEEKEIIMQQQINKGNVVNIGEAGDKINVATQPDMNTINPMNKIIGMG